MDLIKKIFLSSLTIVLLLMTADSYAQSPILVVSGKVSSASGKKLSGVQVTLKSNGATIASVSTSSSGKYPDLEAPMGKIYTLTVSLDGYISKEILIDTKTGYFEEDANPVTDVDIPLDLNEKKPDVDYSAVSNGFQIGKLAIDPNAGGLALDYGFSSGQKKKYEKFFKDLEDEANAEEENFNKLVAEGDKATQNGNYSAALSKYEEALAIKSDPGVTGKVTETKKQIEIKKNFDKAVSDGDGMMASKSYDQAIAKYEAAKALMPSDKTIDAKIKEAEDKKAADASAELDKQYSDKIAEASKALTDKDYAFAKTLYADAGKLKPNEKEPPAKIAEIDKLIKDELEKDQKYAELLAAGNKSMLSEEYDNAISKFEEALTIKKEPSVEADLAKAKELKAKQEANAAKKVEFDKLISSGDTKLSSEDFDAAISDYQSALDMGIDDAQANAKITSAKIAKKAAADAEAAEAAAAKQAEFDGFIAAGEGKQDSEDYDGAIAEYEKALALDVDNPTANAKIQGAKDAKQAAEDAAKAEADAAAAAAKQAEFDGFIAAGEGNQNSEDYNGAIAEYEKALALDVDNPTANTKIQGAKDAKQAAEDAAKAEADAEAAAAKQAEFDGFIAAGEGKQDSEDYDGAIAEYEKALALDVDNPTANAKIQGAKDARQAAEDAAKAEADAAAAAAKQAEFDGFIAVGEGKQDSEDYDGAIAEYEKALALDVDNPTANSKIQGAKDAKQAAEDAAKAEADAAAAAAKQAEFDGFIAAGEGKQDSEDYDEAIAEYEKALALDVDNPTANAKIQGAKDAKQAAEDAANAAANAAEKQAKFDEFIASGDGSLSSESFDDAISSYESALGLDVDNPTAEAKIQEAKDAKIAFEAKMGEEAAAKLAAEKQAKFDEFIASGDGSLSSESFDDAISSYESALGLDVDNPTAEAKIQEAKDAKIAFEAKMGEEAAAKLAAEKQAKFDEFIASGDGSLSSESFDDAISSYENALGLDVDNPTAEAKIQEAKDAKIAFEAKMGEEAAAKLAAEKQAKFDEFIASGDGSLSSESFDDAISSYESALGLDVDNPTAEAKIQEAKDAKIAFEAKMGEEAAAKLAAEKQAKFDEFIASGDGSLSSESFDDAISSYQSALDLDIDNPKAEAKIQAAKDAKTVYETAQNQNDAQAELDAEFNQFIADGDKAKDAEEWENAKSFYSKANGLKPSDPQPQQKIDEVNRLMAEQLKKEQDALFYKIMDKANELADAKEYDKAIGLCKKAKTNFPGKVEPDELIEKINGILANESAEEDEYNALISSADGKFESSQWQAAKDDYLKAKAIFDRPRPNDQIAIIDQRIADEKNKDKAAEELAAKKAQYVALMLKGKSQKGAKSYKEAIATYSEAKSLMPSESEPQVRIDELEKILADKAGADALIAKYNAAIQKADAKRDEAMAKEDEGLVADAKELYNAANKIKADETYPQDEVNKLNNFLKELANKGLEAQYQKIIDKADELFASKTYDGAEKLYKRAITLKAADPYPPAQLKKIKQARANSGKNDEYQILIAEADAMFDDANYYNSKSTYEKASALMPKVVYPKKRIEEINALLEKQKQEAKDKSDANNTVARDPNYMGEKVTGMTELEMQQLLQKGKLDEIEGNDVIIAERKSERLSFEDLEKDMQLNRSETEHNDLTRMGLERSELEGSWDDQRLENIPEVESVKASELAKVESFRDVEEGRSYGVDRYNNSTELERSEAHSNWDEQRLDNIPEMETYKGDELNKLNSLKDVERARSYDIDRYNNSTELDRSAQEEIRDIQREDNIVDMEIVKNKELDINANWTDQNRDLTYNNYDATEDLTAKFETFSVDADVRRQEQTVVEMDAYKFKNENETRDKVERFTTKTDNTNSYNADMTAKFENFAVDSDLQREANVDAMEMYQDAYYKEKNNELESYTEKSLDTYTESEKVKAEQFKIPNEEDLMRDRNVDEMSSYQNQKLDSDGVAAGTHNGEGYDKSLEYNEVKNQKATMFSDENVDALTNTYKEGVTEEMFQRKNNMGEVIEVTILRTVVNGNKADQYKKITTRWTTSYFKNGGVITQHLWDTETN